MKYTTSLLTLALAAATAFATPNGMQKVKRQAP